MQAEHRLSEIARLGVGMGVLEIEQKGQTAIEKPQGWKIGGTTGLQAGQTWSKNPCLAQVGCGPGKLPDLSGIFLCLQNGCILAPN